MNTGWRFALVAGLALALVSASCKKAPEATRSSGPIKVGAVAPGFSLPSADGRSVSLSDFIGKKPVLLYFSMGPG